MYKHLYGKEFDVLALRKDIDHIAELNKITLDYAQEENNNLTGVASQSCRVCGSAETRPFLKKCGFSYRECQSCGSLFMEVLPDTHRLYDEADEKGNYKHIFMNPELYHKRVLQVVQPKVDFVMGCLSDGGGTKEDLA